MTYNKIQIAFGALRKITGSTINYQYDVQQILVINGLNLPEYYVVDFCNEGDATVIPMTGTSDGVEIPDSLLQTGKPVKAYIVVSSGQGDIQTRYEVKLPVNTRPMRDDIHPTDPQQQQIDTLVAALNDGISRSEAAAEAAEQAETEIETYVERAETAAGNAETSASNASSSATNAANSASTATTKASQAASSAQSASQDASAANASAGSAAQSASSASASASAAAGSASSAASSANSASASAGQAASSASSASGSATQAAGSAQSASQSATNAAGSATTATTQAGVATTKAGEAASSATAAGNAQSAAETAQGKAEDAQEAAETAAQSIASAAAQIAQNTQDISDAKNAISNGNLNQHIKVNPFVIGSNTQIGTAAKNRSNLEVQENGSLKITSATDGATQSTYGCYFRIETDNSVDLTGHKLYIKLSGLDFSGATHFTNLRIFGSISGSTSGISTQNVITDPAVTEFEQIYTLTGNMNQFNILLGAGSTDIIGEYYSIGYALLIDLTAMFGAGYEPDIDTFTRYYNGVIAFRLPELSCDIKQVNTQIDAAIGRFKSDVDAELEEIDSEIEEANADIQEIGKKLDNKAPIIINTVSGDIASFSDGADGMPIKHLVAHIEAVQSGTGDPSPDNVRPITGWTGLSGKRCGKNLFKAGKAAGTTNTSNGITFLYNEDGSITINGQNNGNANSFSVDASGTRLKPGIYKKPVFRTDVGVYVQAKENSTSWRAVEGGGISSDTFTITDDNAQYDIAIRVYVSTSTSSETFTDYTVYPYIYLASETDLTYESPVSKDISVNWQDIAGTVYGGTLDVISGKMIVDRRYGYFGPSGSGADFLISNEPNAAYLNTYVYPNSAIGNAIVPNEADQITTALCTHLPSISRYMAGSGSDAVGIFQFHSSSNALRISFPREEQFSTNAKLNEWFQTQINAGTPFAVCFPLKEPVEYQITPQEVTTLLGNNVVYTDVGPVTVEYPADTGIVVAQQSNAISQKQDATSYVTLSGTIVTQTGADNTMYLCGELAELTFTAPQTGICAIRFTSGTTPTVITLTGVTMPDDWTGAEASTTYEINVLNGLGAWQSWT